MLFKFGRISFNLNSKSITLLDNDKHEIIKYITKKEFFEKLVIDIREKATKAQIKSVKEVIKEYFGVPITSDEDDMLMKSFKVNAKRKLEEIKEIMIEYRMNSHYPGKDVLERAMENLESIIEINEPKDFFKSVDKSYDDLLDDAEDTTPVFDFFKGEQKRIYEKTWKYINMFETSKTFVTDKDLINIVSNMTAIGNKKSPYNDIHKLPALNAQFAEKYDELLESEADKIRPILEADKKVVIDTLKAKDIDEGFNQKHEQLFKNLEHKLEETHEIASVINIKLESDALKIRCLDEIQSYENMLVKKKAEEEARKNREKGLTATVEKTIQVKPEKKVKNITMSKITESKIYTFENENEIDKFLAEVKRKLLSELDGNTIVKLS